MSILPCRTDTPKASALDWTCNLDENNGTCSAPTLVDIDWHQLVVSALFHNGTLRSLILADRDRNLRSSATNHLPPTENQSHVGDCLLMFVTYVAIGTNDGSSLASLSWVWKLYGCSSLLKIISSPMRKSWSHQQQWILHLASSSLSFWLNWKLWLVLTTSYPMHIQGRWKSRICHEHLTMLLNQTCWKTSTLLRNCTTTRRSSSISDGWAPNC